jgi:hypothetical protein
VDLIVFGSTFCPAVTPLRLPIITRSPSFKPEVIS